MVVRVPVDRAVVVRSLGDGPFTRASRQRPLAPVVWRRAAARAINGTRSRALGRIVRAGRRRIDVAVRPERHPRRAKQHGPRRYDHDTNRHNADESFHRFPRHTIALLALRARFFIVCYLLSGAAALLYEVAWLRLLTLSMGHTTAAAGAVLAAFMGGLAAGAWASGRFAQRMSPRRALRVYAALEGSIALCALAMPYALGAMRPLLAWAYANGNGGGLFDLVRLGTSIVIVARPAAAMGASYPVGVVAGRESRSGMRDPAGSRNAGELYAANTFGAALGAALTGFVLLPALGLFGTTLVGVGLNAVAAAGALFLSGADLSGPRSTSRQPPIADSKDPRRGGGGTIRLPAMILA